MAKNPDHIGMARLAMNGRSEGEIARMFGTTPRKVRAVLKDPDLSALIEEEVATQDDKGGPSDLPPGTVWSADQWSDAWERMNVKAFKAMYALLDREDLSPAQVIKISEVGLSRSKLAPQAPKQQDQGEKGPVFYISAETVALAKESSEMLKDDFKDVGPGNPHNNLLEGP